MLEARCRAWRRAVRGRDAGVGDGGAFDEGLLLFVRMSLAMIDGLGKAAWPYNLWWLG